MPLIVLLYVACCLMVAYLARDRISGFIGFFVLSLIFSPFLMLLVYLLGMPRGRSA
jgi:uncharacterized membrane protein YhdT